MLFNERFLLNRSYRAQTRSVFLFKVVTMKTYIFLYNNDGFERSAKMGINTFRWRDINMKFSGQRHEELEFKILGYELPENLGPSYEANFLYIELDVKTTSGNWQTDNCALSTTDVEQVIDWFHNLAQNTVVIRDLKFVEQGISFEYVKNTDGQVQFRILLHAECIPKNMEGFQTYPIDFKLNKKELEVIHDNLQKELNSFPTRGFKK